MPCQPQWLNHTEGDTSHGSHITCSTVIFPSSNFQRFASHYFDDSFSDLVRVEEDGAPDDTGSPHIFVKEIDRSFLKYFIGFLLPVSI